jgi:hypothetical protein
VTARITCRACQRPTNAFICTPCTDELEQAFGDLPGLVADVITTLSGQGNAYRYASRHGGDDGAAGPDAGNLIRLVGNTLSTWASHLAETRGIPLVLNVGHTTAGPTCPPHVHDFSLEGCGLRATACRQMRPGHVHDYTPRGCGWDRDPDTGESTCTKFHCEHSSCATIRNGEHAGTAAALVRWLLRNRNAIRYDEAAGDMHGEIVRLRDQLRRFVDRSPAPLFAGPCHAPLPAGRCQRDLYAWINPFAIDPRDQSERPTVTCNGYGSRAEGDRGCGAVHTLADRYEWLLASVDDALLPLVVWQQALPKLFPGLAWPNRTTWWRWTQHEDPSKRRLLPKSIDREGLELFRGGDIVDLVRGEQARIIGNVSKRDRAAS